jgi:hypothetical protein
LNEEVAISIGRKKQGPHLKDTALLPSCITSVLASAVSPNTTRPGFSCYLTPPLTPSNPSQRSEPTFITLKVQSVHTNNRSSRASEVKRPPQVLKVVAQSYRARIARTERHGTQRKQLIQRRCDKLQYHSASTPPRTGDFPAARDGTNQHLNTSKAAASQTYCSGLGR